ncbi:sperm-specific protein PHI-2B/PHI-3-like [Pollicipes pollicipes]|uniref:sperm-specific protein PHI-2B/PHI-3-like n=1 Tax=Pollicipes pollicipes TaxID=41117 RepID=UPI001885A2C2|nr:sperm-specific protein PHI-2B/PHI-3-like [Pollicipes pollicipes]
MADVAAAAATPVKKGRKPKEGGAKKKAAKSSRPPTLTLITKAINAEKDPKGTSVMAIKKYILANHKVKSSVMLNHMLRRAFEAGLKAGKFSRPKGQGESHLLAGRYRLATKEKKSAAAVKPKKPKSPKKAAVKKPKAKTPKKKPAAAKKAKSPKKVKKSPKKPAAKKTAAKKKTPKKAAKKA